MTESEIRQLKSGSYVNFLANDRTIRRLKINGKVRTWARDPKRVEIPVKYGLYEYNTLSLNDAMARLVIVTGEE